MIQAKITEIGTEAINKEEPMLILFDKQQQLPYENIR